MTTAANAETRGFETEVNQLLDLMIHSLYSNKEIFLRELISNASDACDRLRFSAVSDASLYEEDIELKIKVGYDKDLKSSGLAIWHCDESRLGNWRTACILEAAEGFGPTKKGKYETYLFQSNYPPFDPRADLRDVSSKAPTLRWHDGKASKWNDVEVKERGATTVAVNLGG